MELIDNDAVDFIFAVKRFACRNKPADPDFPGIPEIAEWCANFEKPLSPFLLNDISLMIEKTILVSIYCLMRIINNNKIKSVEDFLSDLSGITDLEFISFINNELLDTPDEDITVEKLYEIHVDDGLHPGYDPKEESELLIGFLKEPDAFLKRLHRTYSEFHEQAYIPASRHFQKMKLEKLEWHKDRLSHGGEAYLKELGFQSFIRENIDKSDIVMYFSLFSDNEISSFWKTRTLVIGGGTDQRILHHSARSRADIFFSCFGDPKRLEILRLTAQRPWYSTELANHFDLKPATLSYHMTKLVDAELLNITKGESRRFYYTLNKEEVEKYLDYVAQDLLGLDYDSRNQ